MFFFPEVTRGDIMVKSFQEKKKGSPNNSLYSTDMKPKLENLTNLKKGYQT